MTIKGPERVHGSGGLPEYQRPNGGLRDQRLRRITPPIGVPAGFKLGDFAKYSEGTWEVRRIRDSLNYLSQGGIHFQVLFEPLGIGAIHLSQGVGGGVPSQKHAILAALRASPASLPLRLELLALFENPTTLL